LFRLGLWLSQGKAQLKEQLARRTQLDAALLPYNEEFLAWLAQEKAKGRSLVLCTASDSSFAQAIAAHLGLFDAVMASDGVTNLAGTHKAKALVDKFGAGGFDYAGNSMTDCHVWRSSAEAVVVNAPSAVLAAAQKLCPVERVFQARPCGLSVWRRVLRAHQWLKNLLLFVPLVAAHQLSNSSALSALLLAFIAFSLCASSVYILNDLLDIDSDRAHPHKKHRPFASGLVPISYGVVLAPLLLIASFAIAAWVRLLANWLFCSDLRLFMAFEKLGAGGLFDFGGALHLACDCWCSGCKYIFIVLDTGFLGIFISFIGIRQTLCRTHDCAIVRQGQSDGSRVFDHRCALNSGAGRGGSLRFCGGIGLVFEQRRGQALVPNSRNSMGSGIGGAVLDQLDVVASAPRQDE
jgi:UbiA prenyltransferase family